MSTQGTLLGVEAEAGFVSYDIRAMKRYYWSLRQLWVEFVFGQNEQHAGVDLGGSSRSVHQSELVHRLV
jgi:hypothetical protein